MSSKKLGLTGELGIRGEVVSALSSCFFNRGDWRTFVLYGFGGGVAGGGAGGVDMDAIDY